MGLGPSGLCSAAVLSICHRGAFCVLDETLPLTACTVHLCVDMQKLFGPSGPWATPWMDRVLPVVLRLAERHPSRTIFTRFITPSDPNEMPGQWQKYYHRWKTVTLAEMDPSYLQLLPPLARLVPPATIIDKTRYSAFAGSILDEELRRRRADGLIVTGSETDVCVLATVLDAVDKGYRVILARDAVCSSSDEGHDALLKVYHGRYSQQIETADAEEILDRWAPD
jgi:nicotinamidase-related amidase